MASAFGTNLRSGFGIAFAATLMAIGGLPSVPASAQQVSDDPRYLTVLQRPRDQFDPKGLTVGGGLVFTPSLGVSEAYDDNIYATRDNVRDDLVTTITPRLGLDSKWSRHKLSVKAFADIRRYIDNGSEDNDQYGVDADLGLDLAHGGSIDLQAGYGRRTISRGDPQESGRLTPEQIDAVSSKVAWEQKFSRLLLGASASLLDWQEVSNLDADKNRKEYGGTFRVGYIFSPALNAFIEPFYTKRDFDRAFDFSGINRDSDVWGVNGGVGYDLTGVLYGETRIGWYTTNFSQSGLKNNSGLSVQSRTTWNPTARDTLIFDLQRVNVITTDVTASSRVLTGGGIELQHELTRNITLQANISYFDDDFVDSRPNRVDHRLEGSVRGDYYLNRFFAFYLRYYRGYIDSTVRAQSYDENQITFGIRAQL